MALRCGTRRIQTIKYMYSVDNHLKPIKVKAGKTIGKTIRIEWWKIYSRTDATEEKCTHHHHRLISQYQNETTEMPRNRTDSA